MKTTKNIVTGFGRGGKTLAKFSTQKGEEVLVIEKFNKIYDGTCISTTCLSSKRLIIEASNGVSYVDAMGGKDEMIVQLRNKSYHMLADEKTVTVPDGEAHFIADHEIEVILTNGEKEQFKGERILINIGAVPVMLSIPGLKESKYILDSI